ncbi:dTDP-4-dehydrorhamnose reductase [Frigoribacterium sp. CG_9.8]|uniref:dTDP-4-dehydrorhamnose reductase n=1 Tax=Frigoribacterium sp. CG_9.8 TaxID=2787733 RepID=UPI0018C917D4|nr:dTDP-4-dehydrorhamnose reductase [Frigoribacterium sp. CG_9.8]MBG6106736.1 dTDP-4-dehydrorhamnose reductase [Frigoribacterium sp. CG_9.8]
MTRYLITGAAGMLGQDLQKAFAGRDVTALNRVGLDVTDLDTVRAAVVGHDVVINASAYTRVDDAESHEEEAFAVNATGAHNLAIAASEVGAKLVQVSTDYVFDGSATSPYEESTPRNPISAYGRTKAEGERLALAANPDGTYIVRTAWLYGAGGPNFAKTMLRLAASHDTVSVVNDQLGQPTWTGDLARQIVELLDADAAPGVYHATNSGEASWFDFATEIFRVNGLDPQRVTTTTSADYVRPAPRPDYSVLGHDAWARAGISPMRNWRAALSAAHSAGALQIDMSV